MKKQASVQPNKTTDALQGMLQWLFFYKKNKQGNVTGIHSSCFKLVVLLKNKKIKKTNNDATKGLIVRELLFVNHTSLGRYRSTANRDSRNSTAQQTPSGLLTTFTGIKLHQKMAN